MKFGRMLRIAADPNGPIYVFHCPACGYGHPFDKRWTFNGDPEKPTFSPSLMVNRDAAGDVPRCHLFLRDGMLEFLGDCTHALAGKTVPLPDFDEAPSC